MRKVKDYGSRKDGNHNEIKKYFEDLKCRVKDVSMVPAFCDLIVKRGHQVRFIEIKDPTQASNKQRLTGPEKAFWEYWNEDPVIVKTYQDVIRVVEGMI